MRSGSVDINYRDISSSRYSFKNAHAECGAYLPKTQVISLT